MLFEGLEVLLVKPEHLDIAALVLLEVELDINPEGLNNVESLLHLGLLHGLVGDLLDVFSDLAELEVVDVDEAKVFVNNEPGLRFLTNHVPMTGTHGWVTELTAKGKELEPLFDLFKKANVCVALLVDFHLLEGSLEFLDLFFHVVGLSLFPGVVEVTLEDGLAISDMIPEALHEANLRSDLVNLVLRLLNSTGVLELRSVVLELISAGLEITNFTVHCREASQRLRTASVVAVEVTLLHGSDESLEFLLVFGDNGGVTLALLLDKRSDLLSDVLSELVKASPLVEEFLSLLHLLILGDAVGLEELERLVKLIEQKAGLFLAVEDSLHAVLDSDEGFHISEILTLDLGAGMSFLHECAELLDLLLSILNEAGASQVVVLGISTGREACGVGGTANSLPSTLVVLVGNLDIDIAFLGDAEFDVVLAIVGIGNLRNNLLSLLLHGLEGDLEVVTS